MAGRGTDILLGGNAEFLTQRRLLKARDEAAEEPVHRRRAVLYFTHDDQFDRVRRDTWDDIRRFKAEI